MAPYVWFVISILVFYAILLRYARDVSNIECPESRDVPFPLIFHLAVLVVAAVPSSVIALLSAYIN